MTKTGAWIVTGLLVGCGLMPARLEAKQSPKPIALKGWYSSPPGGYRKLYVGKLFDRAHPQDYYVDLVNLADQPHHLGISRLRSVKAEARVNVLPLPGTPTGAPLPPGDERFTCRECVKAKQAETRVVQLRVEEECGPREAMRLVATDHESKTVHVECVSITQAAGQ